MNTLYLSRLALNPLRREVQRDLADCHNMHRRLLLAFPDQPDISSARDHFGVLYRVEPMRDGPVVLVQSSHIPDWTRLPQGYLTSTPTTKSLTALYADLRPGLDLAFRLHANPTRRISDRNQNQAEKWRGKRVNLTQEADQLDWLRRKGAASGFTLLTVRARPAGLPVRQLLPNLPGEAPIAPSMPVVADTRARPGALVAGRRADTGSLTFGSVTFEGRLRVTDHDLFLAAIEQGVGSGKAYGFGLLSIAPVPSPTIA